MKSRKRSSGGGHRPGAEPYNAPQLELIRAKLRAYYRAEKAGRGAYGFTWKEFAEKIHVYTKVRIDDDSLSQIAKGQISRGRPRGISRENFAAIVAFLTHPTINALSLEELKEPNTPYRFARQL